MAFPRVFLRNQLLTLTGVLALGVSACSGDGGSADTSSTSVGPTTTTATATASDSDGTDTATTDATATSAGTATTGASGGTTSDSGGSSSGAVFIEDPDGGAGSIECDIWAQDCMDGEKCMPWANDGGNAWNATKCTPVNPNPKQPGDTCTVEGNGVSGVDDCEPAAMCWDVDPETGMGICVAFCKGSEATPMCDDPNTGCSISNDGTLILCLPSCDPLLQDCLNDDLCIPNPTGDGFVCTLDASGDGGVAGDPCEYINVCDPGLFCANADAVAGCMGAIGCCAPFCDISDPNASSGCPGAAQGEECVAWYDAGMEPPGLENVGACVIPQ